MPTPLEDSGQEQKISGTAPLKGPGDGMGPHPSTLGATTLPRPAFLRTWHRRPGEGKAQEVAKEEEEKEEEEEEEEDEEG